jgi:hypothetical protein
MPGQNRLLVAAKLRRPDRASLPVALHQLDHTTGADAEYPPNLAPRAAGLDHSNHPLPKVHRIWFRHPCWPPPSGQDQPQLDLIRESPYRFKLSGIRSSRLLKKSAEKPLVFVVLA